MIKSFHHYIKESNSSGIEEFEDNFLPIMDLDNFEVHHGGRRQAGNTSQTYFITLTKKSNIIIPDTIIDKCIAKITKSDKFEIVGYEIKNIKKLKHILGLEQELSIKCEVVDKRIVSGYEITKSKLIYWLQKNGWDDRSDDFEEDEEAYFIMDIPFEEGFDELELDEEVSVLEGSKDAVVKHYQQVKTVLSELSGLMVSKAVRGFSSDRSPFSSWSSKERQEVTKFFPIDEISTRWDDILRGRWIFIAMDQDYVFFSEASVQSEPNYYGSVGYEGVTSLFEKGKFKKEYPEFYEAFVSSTK